MMRVDVAYLRALGFDYMKYGPAMTHEKRMAWLKKLKTVIKEAEEKGVIPKEVTLKEDSAT